MHPERYPASPVLPRAEWQRRQSAHREALAPFASERLDRARQGVRHPVRDFLFEYYSFKPRHLLRWSPGVGVLLEGATPDDLQGQRFFREVPGGMTLEAGDFPAERCDLLRWLGRYLRRTAERPPTFNCLGLHEWAMVYRAPEVRHATTPLRMAPDALAAFVESQELRCTHFDAYRFFTPEATPRNRHALSRVSTEEYDQPGCVHVTMDLYKWCYKLTPFIPGELLRDAFLLAWEARQLDMRASPYDLRDYGFEPIRIETPPGREEYVRLQRQLHQNANPVRERLRQVVGELGGDAGPA